MITIVVPKRFSQILYALLALYLSIFVIKRVVWFAQSYHENSIKIKAYDDIAYHCSSKEKNPTAELFFAADPDVCRKAMELRKTSPFKHATRYVIDHTHYCLDYPCTELIFELVGSWTGMGIFLVILVCFTWYIIEMGRNRSMFKFLRMFKPHISPQSQEITSIPIYIPPTRRSISYNE
jgi:hypothetical protein